jgi:hypothetical protein
MDGYFSAKRYSTVAKSDVSSSLFGSIFISPLPDERFVTVRDGVAGCGNQFRSGTSHIKSHQFCDVSGIFGTVCPHMVPWKFIGWWHCFLGLIVDISKGESLAYAKTMLNELSIAYPQARRVIGYDIACKLTGSLRIHNQENILPTVAVTPALHAYSHSEDCQITTSGRWRLGIGLMNGEDVERMWGELSKW